MSNRGRRIVAAMLLGGLSGAAVLAAGVAGIVVAALAVVATVKLTVRSAWVFTSAFVFGAAASWAAILFPTVGQPVCGGVQTASVCYSSGSDVAAREAVGMAV